MSSLISFAKIFLAGLASGVVRFAFAIFFFGGVNAFFSHPALIALTLVTAATICIAPFSKVNLDAGAKEDRGSRWGLVALGLVAFSTAIIPPYADRIGLLTIDGEATRWFGVVLAVVGTVLRLYPLFVLGSRFSGLVAIQQDHKLETGGIYSLVRNPSYLGGVVLIFGWVLAFRSWCGVPLAMLLIYPLIGRMHAEERLLRAHFGAEYDAYFARTWRLIPWIY